MTHHPGEIAAFITALCWTITALAFESSGKRIGSLSVNFLRLVLALLFLGLFNWLSRGHFFPSDASMQHWFWLALSGLIGFTLGDLALFQAFVEIGARISLLIMSLVPPLAALLSWLFLGEGLGLQNFVGMCLTLSGIILVILGKDDKLGGKKIRLSYAWQGILLAGAGALGQAAGLVMSKHGMGDYNAFAASQIRVIAGIAGFMLLFTFWGKWRRVLAGTRNHKAMLLVSLGAIFGPFLGVSFSLFAVQHANTGVASTIMAITPVTIIPASVLIFKEKIKWKEVVGAVLAVGGVALFFV